MTQLNNDTQSNKTLIEAYKFDRENGGENGKINSKEGSTKRVEYNIGLQSMLLQLKRITVDMNTTNFAFTLLTC